MGSTASAAVSLLHEHSAGNVAASAAMSLLHEHSPGNVTQVSCDASAFRVIGVLSTCTGVSDGDGYEWRQ